MVTWIEQRKYIKGNNYVTIRILCSIPYSLFKDCRNHCPYFGRTGFKNFTMLYNS